MTFAHPPRLTDNWQVERPPSPLSPEQLMLLTIGA